MKRIRKEDLELNAELISVLSDERLEKVHGGSNSTTQTFYSNCLCATKECETLTATPNCCIEKHPTDLCPSVNACRLTEQCK